VSILLQDNGLEGVCLVKRLDWRHLEGPSGFAAMALAADVLYVSRSVPVSAHALTHVDVHG
jgi:hypothetical protein